MRSHLFDQIFSPPQHTHSLRKSTSVRFSPSQFMEWGVRVYFDMEYRKFSFQGRPYLKALYDWELPRVLLKTSRQVEKSTYLSGRGLIRCCTNNGFRVIYVTPSNEQTRTYSRDKLDDVLYQSTKLQPFLGNITDQSLAIKKFHGTGSIYMLYSAYHNANRLRGKVGDELQIDEYQDMRPELIPVIEACLHHSKVRHQVRSGTPLSLDNHIEKHWLQTSMCEWVVPCFVCGGESSTPANASHVLSSPYFQPLTEENIGATGPVCRRCKSLLNPFHPLSRWEKFNQDHSPWHGFHITQLQAPWIVQDKQAWSEFLYDYEHMNRSKFRNERLGISDDSATRPITRLRLQELASGSRREDLSFYETWGHTNPIWMGIDWSPGDTENSWDVVFLGTLRDNKFEIFYTERIEGDMRSSPPLLLDHLCSLFRRFNVRTLGCDYGMGQDRFKELRVMLGRQRVHVFQYASEMQKNIIQYSPQLGRFTCNKSEIFDSLFLALREGYFKLPAWSEFAEPFGQDFLNVFVEHKEGVRHVFRYSHSGPDDSWNALVYTFLTSMISGNPALHILYPGGLPPSAIPGFAS